MGEISLGDVVRHTGEFPNCIGRVIAINIQMAAVLLLVDLKLTTEGHECYWEMSGYRIENLRKSTNAVLGDPEQYSDKKCWWVLKSNVKVISLYEDGLSKGGNICSVCGCFDEYASPSSKHNNEVRCYRCF